MALPALGKQVESQVVAATFDQAEAVCRPAMRRCHRRSCRAAREFLFGSRPAKSAKSKQRQLLNRRNQSRFGAPTIYRLALRYVNFFAQL
jgi:hypothetical protein